MKFVLVNGRMPVRRVSVRCAARQSAKVICESLPHVSPTAVTSATSVTASSPCQCKGQGGSFHENVRGDAFGDMDLPPGTVSTVDGTSLEGARQGTSRCLMRR